jgi:hypothetical protein
MAHEKINASGEIVRESVDLADVDVNALISGIAGETPKTLANLNATLNAPAQAGEAASAAATVVTAIVGKAAAINPGSAVSVSNASATIAAANAARRSITITNRSLTARLDVFKGSPAVAGGGIPLAPAADAEHPGDSVSFSDYTGIVTGIMSALDGTVGNVSVTEV